MSSETEEASILFIFKKKKKGSKDLGKTKGTEK
jgi:hypothetical protein